ncbi:hypothetical protein H70357_31140 [Paenibacillus sp. FSL H7-0357]|nr:hypothetical protein H70357_31140 [Paenibacillus sp. FSL H7-0357]
MTTKNKIKAKLGQGEGKNYKPWTTVRDFAGSNSQSGRVLGWKTERIHHFLSQLERFYFYILEWSDNVSDIREKYPLSLDKTHDLSVALNIKHPSDSKTKELLVMTTDFVINVNQDGNDRMIARTVLPSNQLASKRTIDKLELERMYWFERDVDWGIVTEKEIPKEMAQNIEWFHGCRQLEGSPFNQNQHVLEQIEPTLYKEVIHPNGYSLSEASLRVDEMLGLEIGSSLWAVQHFIATKRWSIDLNKRIHPSKCIYVERTEMQNNKGKENNVS